MEYVHIGRRNNSLSRSGRLLALLYLAGAPLGIALAAGAAADAWPVLAFAGMEMVVLCLAFRYIGEHAGDYERVAIRGDRVNVEIVDGSAVRRFELNRYWAHVVCDPDGARVALRAHGRDLEIGRHLPTEQRVLLAGRLRRELRSST
ncbi:MAG TPA: DUF2244 domain-containing protein [Burkholderiales bacterium]|nr:DUF2244 domain-containing protein [Burkholderiales bacterium]